MWRLRETQIIVDALAVSLNDTKLTGTLKLKPYADVAELVDALASGASVLRDVEVQVLSSVPN